MNLKQSFFSSQLRNLMLGAAVGVTALATAPVAQAGLTGNIGIFSKYVLRGITNDTENDGAAVQGGLDWSFDNGVFVGYWGSNLDYTYSASTIPSSSAAGFENDFYGGYAGKAGPVSYSVGATQYAYVEVDDSNLFEPFATVGVGPATLGVKYLAQDGWWGNAGDMYWTLAYSTGLPKGFKFSGTVGYYLYNDDDNSKLCNPAPAGCGATTTNSAFRHVDLTLSHPIGATGAEMLMTVVIGGENRSEVDQDNAIVFGVKYGFDI